MMQGRLAAWLVRPTPPSLLWGIAAGLLFIVAETLLVYPLAQIAHRDALAVIFLLGVLVVSIVWGLRLAAVMAVLSALAFNFFHGASPRRFSVDSNEDWVQIAVFLLVAVLASSLAQLARSRAVEAVHRRREADLFAGLTHLMLCTDDLRSVLPEAANRLARAMKLPSASIEPGAVSAREGQTAFPLRYVDQLGTLMVPADLPAPILRRLRERVVPALEMLLCAATDRQSISTSLRASRDELGELANEQAVLRRVAVLVARGVPPGEIVAAVASEAAQLLDADVTRLMRQETPGTVTVIGEFTEPGIETLLGRRLEVDGGVTELVLRTSRPARMDSFEGRAGSLAAIARAEGLNSAIAAPIVVEGRKWGVLAALWTSPVPPPRNAEHRLAQFTELIAMAVANTESREELNASRARLVFAADEARRCIERDLHDGVQQRLVSLGLELRVAEALVPPGLDELRTRLSQTTDGLANAFRDLQEVSRGIHPALLSQGGLGSAIKALARRCPVPVHVRPGPKRRLPSCVEVAAYYAVSEALTNAAKHARASLVDVSVDIVPYDGGDHENLVLSVHDNGSGGADPSLGTGLAGLIDRVEALGGQLRIASPVGGGTSLYLTLPTDHDCAQLPC